jgi:hypothetical protein
MGSKKKTDGLKPPCELCDFSHKALARCRFKASRKMSTP